MDLQLNGKIALVTGSTAGIGNAIASSLAREGAHVIVNGRTAAAVDAAITKIKPQARGEVSGFAGDLSLASVAESLVGRHPAVDILVNNLGIFEVKAFEDISDADWQRFFDVNVLSGARLARLYFPYMRARNWGRIIFISSESAYQIPAEMIHYGMTKAAQIAVSRGLAELSAGTGITVNSVLPGPTRTKRSSGSVPLHNACWTHARSSASTGWALFATVSLVRRAPGRVPGTSCFPFSRSQCATASPGEENLRPTMPPHVT
jgi:NAD(P)-dependent dehydrogenase (short-subunit alcohol dehydrogenase family)